MSEHSTQELLRQYEAAESRLREARIAAADAHMRYKTRLVEDKLAEYAALGIVPGAKVIAVRDSSRFYPETRTPAVFLGVFADWSGVARASLGALKKDGSPSKARRNISFDRLVPFQEDGPEC